MLPYVEILAGLVLLSFGGDLMVRGAVGLAMISGISKLVIGMTVVAFGTSAPEFVVSLDAQLSGSGDLAFGNVVGSNIANILLILGATGLISKIKCDPLVVKRDGTTLSIATLAFVGLCLLGVMERWAGIALLALLGAIYWYTYHSDKNAMAADDDEMDSAPHDLKKALLFTALGLGGLVWGADMLVSGGVSVAREFGVSEAIIGLTLVAIGTSLPELAASVMAARKGHADVAIGGVIGSNMFNLLLIIGAVSTISPMTVPDEVVNIDNWAMIAVTALFLGVLWLFKEISRVTAVGFLILYVGYMAYQFTLRGTELAAAV